jgi:hypothetical protein
MADALTETPAELTASEAFSPLETREVMMSAAGPVTVHRPTERTSRGEVVLLPGGGRDPARRTSCVSGVEARGGRRYASICRGAAMATDGDDLDAMIARDWQCRQGAGGTTHAAEVCQAEMWRLARRR